jgi:hypothetical protein
MLFVPVAQIITSHQAFNDLVEWLTFLKTKKEEPYVETFMFNH